MLQSITYIFKYNSREVSIKVKEGRFHYVYLHYKHPVHHFTARFYILSCDYPTYDSIKAFADNLKFFDYLSYRDYINTYHKTPCYVL